MFRILLASLILSAQIAVAAPVLINGSGATFPYPLYDKWFKTFKAMNPEVEINYQSKGSGAGIKDFTAKTVDFGASDAPMSDQEISAAEGKVLHIPTVLGAVVLTYNLPGIKTLKLDADTLSQIYLGKITKWSDAKIASLNKGEKLPDTSIVLAYRSDSSGTTYVFTEYLSKASETWKKEVGAGKSVKWPVGVGGKGNEGVTGFIKNTPGSFGYIELVYANSEKLPVVQLKNKSGEYITPSAKSVSLAASGVKMPEDFRISVTDSTTKGAYPISAFTYLLVRPELDKTKGAPFVKFLNWSIKEGQKAAEEMAYAPLPKDIVKLVEAKIKSIQLQK